MKTVSASVSGSVGNETFLPFYIYPSALEAYGDSIDNNCDGSNDFDADGPGEDAIASGGTDCDDTNANINSEGDEIANNGLEQDYR